VKVKDTSEECKTAENLFDHLEATIKEVEEKWGVVVVAIVTDASGECRKAHRMLARKYPWIVLLDCYAHQVHISVITYNND
jgi:Mg-chelatase subunit ChlD